MLGQIKRTAAKIGAVRIIKRDIVPRCGPAGGVHAALSTSGSDAILFLACDMPFVQPDLLLAVLARAGPRPASVFMKTGSGIGFPFLISRQALPLIMKQLRKRAFSLQRLAQALKARTMRPSSKFDAQLLNVNTPREWETAKKLWKAREQSVK